MFKKKRKIVAGLLLCLSVSSLTLLACGNQEEVPSDTVSFEALSRRIEFVEQNYLDKADSYTEESFNALKTALENAKEVSEKENATQEEVDAALASLNKAIDDLKSSVPSSSTVDDILNFVDSLAGNYTITFKDNFSSDETKEFTYLFDGNGFYDEENNFGVTLFGDYYHSFKIENNEIVMDRALLGEELLPSFLLDEGSLYRSLQILGVSEQFTSFGLDTYGFFMKEAGQSYFVLDNVNYYDWYLGLTYNRYTYSESELSSMFSKVTMELKDDTLIGQLLNQDKEVAFEFTVTNGQKTEIPHLVEYKTSQETYKENENYNPAKLVETSNSYYEDGNYGVKADLYSNRIGHNGQTPDLTVYNRFNLRGSTYYLTSLNEGLMLDGKTTKEFELNDDKVVIGNESDIDLRTFNLFDLIFKNISNLTVKPGTDEYFKDVSNDSEVKEFLSTFFDLANYGRWAHPGKYGGTPSYGTGFDSYSLSENSDGYLTITLWSGESFIARAVLKEYKDYSVPALEKDSFSQLNALYESVKGLTNTDAKYSAESFKHFDNIRTNVNNYLNSENFSENQTYGYYLVLNNAYNSLELSVDTSSFDNTMDDKIYDYVQNTVYPDEYSSTPNTYSMKYNYNNVDDTYYYTSKYTYFENQKVGQLVADSTVFNYEFKDNKVALTTPAVHKAGYINNYLSRVASCIGNLGIIATEIDLMRMDNSSSFYTDTTSYLNFIPGISEEVHGASFEVKDDKLVGSFYNASGITLIDDTLSDIEKSYLTRGEVIATFEIDASDVSINQTLEEALNKEHLVDKQDILSKVNALSDTFKVESATSEIRAIVASNFYYNLESGEIFAEKNNKVSKLTLTADSESGMPFTILEDAVQIEVDGEKVNATSLSEVKGNLTAVRDLKEENFVTSELKLSYEIESDKLDLISTGLNAEGASLRGLVSENKFAILVYSMDFIADDLFTFDNTFTAQEESDVVMINNIINYFLA